MGSGKASGFQGREEIGNPRCTAVRRRDQPGQSHNKLMRQGWQVCRRRICAVVRCVCGRCPGIRFAGAARRPAKGHWPFDPARLKPPQNRAIFFASTTPETTNQSASALIEFAEGSALGCSARLSIAKALTSRRFDINFANVGLREKELRLERSGDNHTAKPRRTLKSFIIFIRSSSPQTRFCIAVA